MTLEEAKKIEEGTDIVMSCLDGHPIATVVENESEKIGMIVQVKDREGSLLLLMPEHLVKGATSLQAIDFTEEIKIPNGEDIPSFVKRAMVKLGSLAGKVEHTRIGNNVSQYRIDIKDDAQKKNTKPFDGNIGVELIKRIKLHDEYQNGKGIQTAIMCTKEGHLGMAFISVEPFHVFESIRAMLIGNEFPEIAFTIVEDNEGLDDTIKVPGCKYFQKIYMKSKGRWWYGILPVDCVDGKTLNYLEPDWANDTWTERMELDLARADFFEKFMNYGYAMGRKINITKYIENDNGWFYEGNFNNDKMDPKVAAFLQAHNLTANDRMQINEILLSHGKGIKMQKDTAGFITVRAGSFYATERRSKTRAFLEALENVIPEITA
jgi:hypothetical protein